MAKLGRREEEEEGAGIGIPSTHSSRFSRLSTATSKNLLSSVRIVNSYIRASTISPSNSTSFCPSQRFFGARRRIAYITWVRPLGTDMLSSV